MSMSDKDKIMSLINVVDNWKENNHYDIPLDLARILQCFKNALYVLKSNQESWYKHVESWMVYVCEYNKDGYTNDNHKWCNNPAAFHVFNEKAPEAFSKQGGYFCSEHFYLLQATCTTDTFEDVKAYFVSIGWKCSAHFINPPFDSNAPHFWNTYDMGQGSVVVEIVDQAALHWQITNTETGKHLFVQAGVGLDSLKEYIHDHKFENK